MSDNCPDCGHPKATHSFVGCLHDGNDLCECERDFPEARHTTETARAEKTEAMAKAERGTDPDWEAKAEDAITLLMARDSFTPDDVWVLLEEQKVPPPREPRALGPILKRRTKAGDIRPMGFTESRRRHGAPVRIYEARQS